MRKIIVVSWRIRFKNVTWLLYYATQEANNDKWMKIVGEEAMESGNRGPIGICGSDWAVIQKPSSGGIHPGQGKDRRGGIHL